MLLLRSIVAYSTLITSLLCFAENTNVYRRGGGHSRDWTKLPIVDDQTLEEFRMLANKAQLAHCALTPQFANGTCNACDETRFPLHTNASIASPDGYSQGLVGLNPNEGMVYIAFPGSENMVNVKADVKSFLRRVTIGGRQVRVHSGWYGAYERMRENILKTVVPMVLENPEFSVMSIGYSYGCPISVFTALDLIYQQNVSASRVHLTNFGCPRIGNYDFARLVDQYSGISSVRRVIQTNDLVPRINSQALGYRHIGREYWLNSEADQMHFCNDDALGVHHAGATWVYDESPSCHNSLWLVTLSLNAHIAYWNHIPSSFCAPKDPNSAEPYENDVLPFYVVGKQARKLSKEIMQNS